MGKAKQAKRGRKSPFSASDISRMVAVVAKEGLSHAQTEIQGWSGDQFQKISLPTLAKYAKAAGLKLSKGRPALTVYEVGGKTVTATGRVVDKFGRAVPAVIQGKSKPKSKPKAKPQVEPSTEPAAA